MTYYLPKPAVMATSAQSLVLLCLMQLWACILELKESHWKLISVASHADSFEAQLAACKPLDLPQLTVPLQPPGIAPDLPLPQVIHAVILQSSPLCWEVCSLHVVQGLRSFFSNFTQQQLISLIF